MESGFHGRPVLVLQLEIGGGPQDINDARRVLQGAGAGVDLPLLRRLAARYGRQTSELLESILASQTETG